MDKILNSRTARFVIMITCVLGGFLINGFGPVLLYESLERGADVIVPNVFPFAGYLLVAVGVIIFASNWIQDTLNRLTSVTVSAPLQAEFEQAIQRAQAEPEKAKPAWDTARIRLELYFDRNLSQINYIFWLSVLVMLVGFGFILFGISRTFVTAPVRQDVSIQESEKADIELPTTTITPAIVGSIAGVITEFIGATFLFIYRSTIQQAGSHIETLERINSVGMAMQILDTISTDSRELRDQTKAEIVKMLLLQSEEALTEKPPSG